MTIESILTWIRNYIQENEGPLVVAVGLAVLFLIYRGYRKGVRWGSSWRDTPGADLGDPDGDGGGEANGD